MCSNCVFMAAEGCIVYTDLSSDETLFEGSGDYQFDIYRLMRDSNQWVLLLFLLSQCWYWVCWTIISIFLQLYLMHTIHISFSRSLARYSWFVPSSSIYRSILWYLYDVINDEMIRWLCVCLCVYTYLCVYVCVNPEMTGIHSMPTAMYYGSTTSLTSCWRPRHTQRRANHASTRHCSGSFVMCIMNCWSTAVHKNCSPAVISLSDSVPLPASA